MLRYLLLFILILAPDGLCQVAIKVKTNKITYLVGEPVFIVVEAQNVGTEAVGYSYCDGRMDLSVVGAEPRRLPNLWGCSAGIGGSSACGLDHPPLLAAGESATFRYLLKDYSLSAGEYILHSKGKAGVRWKYYSDMRPNAPPRPAPQHKEGDPVPGADFDVASRISVNAASEDELYQAYAPYLVVAAGTSTGTEEMRRAREAIVEMAPALLEKTIARFASDPMPTPDLAVRGLGRIDTQESRVDLIKLYDESTDLRLRTQIVEALAGMATQEQSTFFADLLPGRSTPMDDQIRQWAALGLGKIGGDTAARALEIALSHPSSQVRFAVAVALGNTRSRIAVAFLIQMYGDKDAAVSNEVCSAMKELTHFQWCDGSGASISAHQRRWRRWWKANAAQNRLYGESECPKWNAQLPQVQ